MRLQSYIDEYTPLLIEKVNKKEVNEILNSTDVLVGAEFEFVVNDAGEIGNPGMEGLADDAYRDAERYNEEVIEYQEEMDELNDKLNKIDRSIDDLQDEINDLENEIERLELLNYDEDKGLLDKMRKDLDNKEDEIKKAEQDLKEAEDERDGLDVPAIGSDYTDYMDQIGYDNDYIEPGEEVSMPPSWENVNDGREMDEEMLEQWIKNVNPKPPFDRYRVGGYGNFSPKPGSKEWAVETDSSLSEGGVEIKSPPLPLKEFIKVCPKMFKWIDDVGHTDSSCGFHIHMSLKNIPNLESNLDIMKLILFTDEGYIYKFFKNREDSTYAHSMKKKVESATLSKKDWDQFVDYKKLRSLVYSEHYNGINWQTISDNHIEFRYLGSSDYHRKWDKIKVIIAQYGYNLNLACNPAFKQKEYILKTRRLFNKIEDRIMSRVHRSINKMIEKNKEIGTKKGEMFLKKVMKTLKYDDLGKYSWQDYTEKAIMNNWAKVIDVDKDTLISTELL